MTSFGSCYGLDDTRKLQQLDIQWGPCGFETPDTQAVSCCWMSELCMQNGLCQYSNGPGTGFGYFLGGCTDSSFGATVCGSFCESYSTNDVTYNYTSGHWYCCGNDCANPEGKTPYNAPPPESLYATASIGSSQMFFPIQGPVTATTAVRYTSLTYEPTSTTTMVATTMTETDVVTVSVQPSTTTATVTMTVQATVAASLVGDMANNVPASASMTPAGVWAGLGIAVALAVVALAVLAWIWARYRRVAKELRLSKQVARNQTGWHEKVPMMSDAGMSPYTVSSQEQAAELGPNDAVELGATRTLVEAQEVRSP